MSDIGADLQAAYEEGYEAGLKTKQRTGQMAYQMAIKALEAEPTMTTNARSGYVTIKAEPCDDAISRQAAQEKISNLINEMETIFSDIREKLVDDSVCGLCEYDCDHGIDGYANECPGFERDDCFKLKEEYRDKWNDLSGIPSVTPKQRTGHWIEYTRVLIPEPINKWEQAWKCSECGYGEQDCEDGSAWIEWKFCPNCGAKMEGEPNGEISREEIAALLARESEEQA